MIILTDGLCEFVRSRDAATSRRDGQGEKKRRRYINRDGAEVCVRKNRAKPLASRISGCCNKLRRNFFSLARNYLLYAINMSDTQLKRKRSQREKAPATTLTKRPRTALVDNDSAQNTPKSDKTQTPSATPKTEQNVLPQSDPQDGDKALQVAALEGKKRTRRSKRRGDRVAVDEAQVTDKPVAPVEGKPTWLLSKPVGGRLIQHDPIFSQDERYVVLARDCHVSI